MRAVEYRYDEFGQCVHVCVWEREEGEGGGARTREGINSQSDAPMVIVPGVLWWMGRGSGRGCGCHYTVLVFRLLFLQRLRTLLSACELFSVSISVLGFYNDDVSNPFVLFLFFLVFPPPPALLPSLPLPFHPSLPPSAPPPSLQDVRLSRFPPELWHRMQSKPCTSLRLWRYGTLALSSTLCLFSAFNTCTSLCYCAGNYMSVSSLSHFFSKSRDLLLNRLGRVTFPGALLTQVQ